MGVAVQCSQSEGDFQPSIYFKLIRSPSKLSGIKPVAYSNRVKSIIFEKFGIDRRIYFLLQCWVVIHTDLIRGSGFMLMGRNILCN